MLAIRFDLKQSLCTTEDEFLCHNVFLFTAYFRPAANPLNPKGPQAIELFLVLFFRKMVADPLATLRDHVMKVGKLGPRMAFKESLRNLGECLWVRQMYI